MKNQNMQPSVVDEAVMAPIQARIKCVRNVQVMLDRDLAELYGVPVKRLNEQVKRNLGRFPADFMFQLTKDDCLRSQIATLNGKRGTHLKYLPYAFTENGIAMLQYKGLAVTYSNDFHDRFLIIDNVELHGLGSSINCLGRRVTSYTTRDPKEIAKLLATIRKS